MKRTERLQVVQRVADDHERRRAERLAASERRVLECEARLSELESYQAGYARDFARRVQAGIGGAALRDYQTFMTRLGEAVCQQGQVIRNARAERDAQLRQWQAAAQRAGAVGHVVERMQAQEQRLLERREQRETDERAQYSHARGPYAHST